MAEQPARGGVNTGLRVVAVNGQKLLLQPTALRGGGPILAVFAQAQKKSLPYPWIGLVSERLGQDARIDAGAGELMDQIRADPRLQTVCQQRPDSVRPAKG